MRASELRIGNYLKWKDNNQEFEITLSLFLSRDFWNHIEHNDIIPIPLTDERLLKFEFKLNESGFIWIKDGIELANQQGLFWFLNPDGKEIELSQVHKLQNLYFALRELELKKEVEIIIKTKKTINQP